MNLFIFLCYFFTQIGFPWGSVIYYSSYRDHALGTQNYGSVLNSIFLLCIYPSWCSNTPLILNFVWNFIPSYFAPIIRLLGKLNNNINKKSWRLSENKELTKKITHASNLTLWRITLFRTKRYCPEAQKSHKIYGMVLWILEYLE